MDFTNYLTMRSANLASMRATHLALSTLTGSTLSLTTHITAPMAMYSTMIGSTITVSTLTVSSINNNLPGTFSTLTVSSLVSVSTISSASTIYTSSLLTTGNVGIGSTTPVSQLAVHGNTSTSITVSNGFNSGFFTQYGLAHSAGQYSAHSVAGDTVIDAVGGNLIIESPNKNILMSVPNANTPNLLSIVGAGIRVTNNSAGWGSLTNTQKYSNINLSWTAPVTCYISSISMFLGQGNNGTNISMSINGVDMGGWWPFQGYGLYVLSATGSSTANGVATTPTPFSAMNQLIVQAGHVVSIWISALQTFNFFYYGRDSTTNGVGFSVVYTVPQVDLSLSSTPTLSLGLTNVGIGTTNPTSRLSIHAGATNTVALNLISSGPGWGSGIQFTNSTASTGRIYGIYSGSDSALHIVDSTAGTDRIMIASNGDITTTSGKFIATGTIANINGGSNFAVLNNYMQTGSLTIGDTTKNYGGGTSTWNANTAGLMMECLDNTEIAVHDAGSRVASMMYYSTNTITLGRNMGWGVSDVVASNNLSANCLIINGGGTYQAGCIYSDAAWGMLFRAKVPGTNANFAWFDSAGTERMRIDAAGDTSTSGKLTVQDVIRFGNYSGGNYDNIQFMRGTGSGQFPNIRCQNNYIGMYSSGANGWISGSAVGDMTFLAEAGRNIRLSVGGSPALVVDSSNNVIIAQRELRINQMNGHGQIRLKSGNTNIATMFHCNGTELYFLNTNNGDWEGGYNGLRPLKYSLTSGLVTMDNGLTVNNTITVANGDNSMTYYGPNSMWGAYLAVGSGTTKVGASTAQVISTNGNLHLDAGTNKVMYYGHYTTNTHQFYGHIHVATSSYMSFGSTEYLFPIYIPYGRSYYFHLYHYLHIGGVHNHNAANSWNVSIWTDGVLVTSQWYGTVSDQRIKKNIQPVGTMLETINKIEIVSFDFIDEPNNKRDECGIIAQQLETVFPNAVDTSTGVIPCYLKFATSQHLVEDDVHILFEYDSTDTQQQFKIGDKIKIHAGQSTADKGSHHVVVKSVIDGGFVTAKWKDYHADDGVFLHGKEVDDFRNVDKEQLGILALKGVQELSSMISTLNGTCASLQASNALLQQENTQLKSQMIDLQAANAATSSQMAALNGTCATLQEANAATSSQMAALLAWARTQGYSS